MGFVAENDRENIISLGVILLLFLAILLLSLFYRDWLLFGVVVFMIGSSILLLNRTIQYPIIKGIASMLLGLFMGLLLWVGVFLLFFAGMS